MSRIKIYILMIIIAILGGSLTLYVYLGKIVPDNEKFSKLAGNNAQTFILRTESGQTIAFQQQEEIQKFHEIVQNKNAKRITISEAKKIIGLPLVALAYNSDKGRQLTIDQNGQIFILVEKSEIRNKSILHWLWWKLDTDPSTSLYYYTSSEDQVVNIINIILSKIEK